MPYCPFLTSAAETVAASAIGVLARPISKNEKNSSSKDNVFKINVDEFEDHPKLDNGLMLSNGTPRSSSANESNSIKFKKDKNVTKVNESNEPCEPYITPGVDLLLAGSNYDVESGKKSLEIYVFVD